MGTATTTIDMSAALTPGAVQKIRDSPSEATNVRVQVLDLKSADDAYSATLNDGENTIPAKFSSDCGGKPSSGAVKDNAVLKLTDVAYECASEGERKPFAVINGFEVVEAVTPAAKVAKTEPKTPRQRLRTPAKVSPPRIRVKRR